jgi:mannose-6-phosphate isomerase-like protein (cupin superfamily)
LISGIPTFKRASRIVALTCAVAAVPALFAQFGGKPGDAVIYIIGSKGNGSFGVVPSSTINPASVASRFEMIDPVTLPKTPASDFFPSLLLQVLHDESDDKFQLVNDTINETALHHVYLITFKVFTLKGLNRQSGDVGEDPVDIVPNLFTSFRQGMDLGPNTPQEQTQFLIWTGRPQKLPFVPVPRGQRGPYNPPGETGNQVLLDGTIFPILLPWKPLARSSPGVGWPDGVESKFLESDPLEGSVAQMIRLKPGRRTPKFRINGATHFYVLEGRVRLTPAGGTPIIVKADQYCYLPAGFAFTLENLRTFNFSSAR